MPLARKLRAAKPQVRRARRYWASEWSFQPDWGSAKPEQTHSRTSSRLMCAVGTRRLVGPVPGHGGLARAGRADQQHGEGRVRRRRRGRRRAGGQGTGRRAAAGRARSCPGGAAWRGLPGAGCGRRLPRRAAAAGRCRPAACGRAAGAPMRRAGLRADPVLPGGLRPCGRVVRAPPARVLHPVPAPCPVASGQRHCGTVVPHRRRRRAARTVPPARHGCTAGGGRSALSAASVPRPARAARAGTSRCRSRRPCRWRRRRPPRCAGTPRARTGWRCAPRSAARCAGRPRPACRTSSA